MRKLAQDSRLEGKSGSDLYELCREAMHQQIPDMLEHMRSATERIETCKQLGVAPTLVKSPGGLRAVSMDDFERVLLTSAAQAG